MVRYDYAMRRFIFILLALAVLVVVWKSRTGFTPSSVTPPQPVTPSSSAVFASGYHYLSLQHGGLVRTYGFYVPTSYDGKRSLPAIIVFHGGGAEALGTHKGTCPDNTIGNPGCFSSLADHEGFFLLYPEAIDKTWNDGRDIVRHVAVKNVDDMGFVKKMLGEVAAQVSLDVKRVYATGISNGGLISFRMACEHADTVAAIVPIAGSMGLNWAGGACKPSRAVSILMMNGDNDFIAATDKAHRLNVADTLTEWARINGCIGSPTITSLPDTDPNDGTTVVRTAYTNCKSGSEVASYLIKNGGHTWPGGYQYLGERLIGKTTRDISANEEMWKFFRAHPIRN